MSRFYTLKVDNAGTLVDESGRPLDNQTTWEVFDRTTGDPVAVFDNRADAWKEAREQNKSERSAAIEAA